MKGEFNMNISMYKKDLDFLYKIFGDITFVELVKIVKDNRKIINKSIDK